MSRDAPGDAPLKVLIVDDDPIVLESMGELFSEQGYEVYRRERALGTSSWIMKERPDIVLVDVNMPGLAGQTILEVTRERIGDETPAFILMSSMPESELQRLSESSGAHGFLVKGQGDADTLSCFRALAASHARARAAARSRDGG